MLTIFARAGFLGIVLAAIIFASRSHPPAFAASDCAATGSPAGPYAFDTWEPGDYKSRYGGALTLAGFNQLFPDIPNFALPTLETDGGVSSTDSPTPPPPSAYVPPVLLKAIAYIESGWAMASYDPLVAYGQTGPALVSADCGYGLMQVTSGMQNVTGIPTTDQVMIGSNYAFNAARGAQILASKWNEAPELRPVVGNRDPHIIENWYYALWAYNGFAFRNHPLNSGYDPNRQPFSCQDGASRDYPYQELILGCVANPPVRDGKPLWDAVPVTLPNLSDPAFSGPLDVNNWNACSLSAQCGAMNIPTPGGGHTDPTVPATDRTALLGLPAISAATQVAGSVVAGFKTELTVSVVNNSSGIASWRALSSAPWMKTSLQGISLGPEHGGHSTPLTLKIDATKLEPGTYTANVGLESVGTNGAPLTIAVSVQVNRPSNCNGTLDAADALALLQAESGIGGCVADVPDMNCDGVVNGADVELVLKYLAGASAGPPQCG